MEQDFSMHANPLVAKLQKPASEFTKADIVSYIKENGITMVNFMYPAADGRLKTLNFVINDAAYLDAILTCGERVDGSSLFPFIEAGSSDLYVIPRFCTAFIDPFAEQPTLSMLCSFFNKDGEPLESSPEHTLRKACRAFTEVTGMEFQAMGELEYYVISEDSGMFPATDQRGYHESAPYAKFNEFRTECMAYIAQAGGQIKYGHSEVGNFTLDGKIYEQNEIEFLPVRAEQAADQLMIAKWIIRNLAYQYGYDITFAPKITAGKAGSGLHIHMRIMKDGKNMMLDADGKLSETARRAIAGMMNREQVDVLCLQEFMDSREFPADSIGKVFAPRMPYFLHEGSAALVSRYPVLDHKYVRFADTSNDYLRADLLGGGDTVRLFAVHLQTSGIAQLRHRFRKDYDRDAPVEQILGELEHNSSIRAGQVGEIRAEMDASPYPVILAGDFNDTPSSYTYRTMKGDMTDGFRDSGSGYGGTFRYLGGVLRIDYIFYDDAFEGIRYYMPPEDVSDHKAVVAELRFR